jgi:hypothetical protein
MHQTESEAHDVMARYLSGRLSAGEAARFEAWWARNPAAIHEIDRVARMQDGLLALRERGELEPLLRRSWWAGTLRFMAMAASVGTLALAAWLWQAASLQGPLRIAALPGSFDDLARSAPAAAQYFMTLRTRDGVNTVALPATPLALHWRLLPDHQAQDGQYRVTLKPAAAPDTAVTLAALATASDGFVDVYVDSRSLGAGRYSLEIEPAAVAPGSSQASRFELVVSDGQPTS